MAFRINTNINAMTALRNLGMTGESYSGAMNRLSTGMRINTAADDPSGLIFSENLRAKIGGIDAAVRNNQDAINYSKTAEGAMDEISHLLVQARSLAVTSSNTAVLDSNQLQANQSQLNGIISSINRISSQTQFGNKKLLDGSSGVDAALVATGSIASVSMTGTFNGGALTTGGVLAVNVTQAATQATVTGTRTVAAASLAAYQSTAVGAATGSFSINGQTFTAGATDTWASVITKINQATTTTGITATAIYGGGVGQVQLTSSKYGTVGDFTLADSGVLSSAAGTTSSTGTTNAIATATLGGTTVTFTGGLLGADGLTMSDGDNNKISLVAGTGTGAIATAAYVTVGSAQFQTGGNAGQRATLSIGNFSASSLGVSALNLTNATGSGAAIGLIDTAISNLNLKRGEIGSFMANVLQSNVRSLGVAKENLSASESQVRDTDVAAEMTNFTKLQILQQSGLSVLAQANSGPQQVLSLLRQ